MALPGSRRWRLFLAAAALAALATTASGAASTGRAQASPRVTVAAVDPSLVAGRGADLGIVEQEAENADTNGTILPFDTSAYTLFGEASGRRAVKLAPGQYVAFTLTEAANALTIRYAIPDAPTGGGIDSPLTVGVDHNGDGHGNTHQQTITLTSKYSYLYNLYRSRTTRRRRAAPGLVDHRMQVRSRCDHPAADGPHPVQADALLRRAARAAGPHLPAGSRRALERAADSNAAWTVVDLADFQNVRGTCRPECDPSCPGTSPPIARSNARRGVRGGRLRPGARSGARDGVSRRGVGRGRSGSRRGRRPSTPRSNRRARSSARRLPAGSAVSGTRCSS